MKEDVAIGQAELADMTELMSLVHACPEAPDWSQNTWRSFVSVEEGVVARRAVLLLARRTGGELIGCLAARSLFETAELEFVLVHPRHRGEGIGARLVERWLAQAVTQGAREALLEVRASNAAALRIYERVGFVEQGRRLGYYHQPKEDAVLMGLSLILGN